MKCIFGVVAAFAALVSFGGVQETDWAKVEFPDRVSGPFEVKVTLKGSIPDTDVSTHLHWKKAKGWGGFLAYHPQRKAKSGKTYTFSFRPQAKPDMAAIDAVVFLAPGGDFAKQTKNLHCNIAWGGAAKASGPSKGDAKKPTAKRVSNYAAKPDSVTFKKSYIWLEEAPKPTRAGEDLVVKIRYRLDPSDTWGDKPTQLMCMPLGPWIDNPDGVVNTKRHHVGYPGMFAAHQPVEVGEHVAEFRYKLSKTYRYNGCSFLCKFKAPDGSEWPWEWRGGSMTIIKESETFFLEPTALGGLFLYGEPLKIKVGFGPKASGTLNGTVVVRNSKCEKVYEGPVTLDATKKEDFFELPALKEKGFFYATLKIGDLGEDYCYFGTIPKFARVNGRRTPFGITNIYDEDFAKLGAKLGFSFTRLFTTWKELEPVPGKWQLDHMDKTISLNADNGLLPWICFYAPPAWALPEGMWSTGFEPSPFNLKAWGNAITTLSKRYDGKLFGWEWLNEIVPGNKCKDPVADYVNICTTGYQAAKAVNPKLVTQLAGGLWPHNYRIDCLNAGVAKWVDVLPVHYSTYEGILEAKNDLSVRDFKKVRVADNETASGMSVWNMDAEMTTKKSIGQCRHVMTRWPDELCAGSLFITYFGGGGDPCGNWSYMIDKKSPRPVAVTLAVVQGKIGFAKAVGKFFYDGLPVQLFERDGEGILFVTSPGKEGVRVRFPAKGKLSVTDYMGNVSSAAGGNVVAGDMPVIVEGFDLDQMKLHAALRVGTSELPAAKPQVVADAGETIAVPVFVKNPWKTARKFTLTPSAADWGKGVPVTLSLEAGASKSLELTYKTSGKIPATTDLKISIATAGLNAVDKPFLLYAVDPSSIGNLLQNGDFENGSKPWGGVKSVATIPMPNNADNHAVEFKGNGNYQSMWQGVDIPVPGQSYLYTCWMWTTGQEGGSNVSERFSDGTKEKQYYMPNIFSIGAAGSKTWRYMVKRFDTKANTKNLGITPVTRGKGSFRIDNVSLSLYKGSEFSAFAGRVGGEKSSSMIPLLCDNQIRTQGGYDWKPEGFAGVAEFSWDKSALTLKCSVRDDVLAPKSLVGTTKDGEEGFAGDMLAVALFPKMGADGMPESAQMRWYISMADPGGGSGKTTLFRPKKYSLGMKSGQLAKDSSVYQVDFKRSGDITTYEVKIPWSEIPGFTPAKGASFGCNLILVDGDNGGGTGRMVWGADRSDSASGCGIVTLLP